MIVAMVTAAVTAGGPALADGVRHALFAHNADKVDGKHAVGAGASLSARAGKLVATKSSGRLPNDIIAKAPDASKLGGSKPAAFASIGDSFFRSGFFIPTCSSNLEIASIPVPVSRPSRIFASAAVNYSTNGTNGNQAFYRLTLLDEGGAAVATAGVSDTWSPSNVITSAVLQGVLRTGTSVNGASPFVATSGTYTLRLAISTTGTCGGSAGNAHSPGLSLSYILTGTK